MKLAILALALSVADAFVAPGAARAGRMVELDAKKSVADMSEADLKGKKVLIRCDLNVPLKDGVIGDDTRIRASVPTDGPEDKFSLGPVSVRMAECLGKDVKMAPDCIGDEVSAMVGSLGEGEAMLLENTRFYKEEEKNEAAFVEKLAAPFDLFVNDAFGTAHRAHASTEGVTKFLSPSVSGYLLAKELKYLAGAVDEPFDAEANTQVVDQDSIPDGWMGLDNGPKATKEIQEKLADCKTVIWNGPMGVFEIGAFAKGTFAICDTLAELTEKGCVTIIGGGDSVAAVEKAGLADKMSHISTAARRSSSSRAVLRRAPTAPGGPAEPRDVARLAKVPGRSPAPSGARRPPGYRDNRHRRDHHACLFFCGGGAAASVGQATFRARPEARLSRRTAQALAAARAAG
ncbi:phosphoglycerate kinase [Aureococcus anophagefferens]|nr:phosphoglycerate kinase [Aureococcus anophagefferens]